MEFQTLDDLVPSPRIDGSGVASASAGVYGSWAQITSGLACDVVGFMLCVFGVNNTNLSEGVVLIDLGCGPAGSEITLATFVDAWVADGVYDEHWIGFMPLALPKGTRLAVRTAGFNGSITYTGVIRAIPLRGGLRHSAGCKTFADTIWISVTAGNPGAWTEMSSALPHDVRYIMIYASRTSPLTVDEAMDIQVGIGPSGSETVIVTSPQIFRSHDARGHTYTRLIFAGAVKLPKGTRLSVRGINDASADDFYISASMGR